MLTIDGVNVYYLVTKQRFNYKPTYETLRSSVKAMAVNLASLSGSDVHTLALPKIGCGLDRLDWSRVRKILIEELRHLPVHLHVFGGATTKEIQGSRKRSQ